MGKVYLFSSALSAEFFGLAIIAALNSALACAYYFRVPVAILSAKDNTGGSLHIPVQARLAIGLCAVAVVVFGALPENLLVIVRDAAQSLLVR
jgi:NADH-quinone oxidoreductase subunit N